MSKPRIDFHELFNYKRIYDSVHGTIGLSETELKILDCRAFQRLRNIKQLGLAHLAFPEADYSRFSHSIGVCHITGLFLESLYKNGFKLSKRNIKRYRLAGLLHDIGHYPFSHTMEHAVQKYNKKIDDQEKTPKILKTTGAPTPKADMKIEFLKHEDVGKEILMNDEEIKKVLKSGGFKPKDIYPIFTGTDKNPIPCLISSDIDADRIDYLLRTSYATKLPYGSVDLPYILSQIRLDKNNRICFTEKALRPLDHFLLSRYFDYQRVAYNKTTVALDKFLQSLIIKLIDDGKINLSKKEIKNKLGKDSWYKFDDSYILSLIKNIIDNSHDIILKSQAQSVLERKPPTLLINIEFIGNRYEEEENRIHKSSTILNAKIDKWSSKYQIDSGMWLFWEPDIERPIALTKTGTKSEQDEEKDILKNILILDSNKEIAEPIYSKENSLMSSLADKRLYCLRLYAFLGNKTDDEKKNMKEEIYNEYLEEFNKLP